MKSKMDEMYLPMPKSTTDVSASTDSMISLRSPRRSVCEGFRESEGWRKEKRWREEGNETRGHQDETIQSWTLYPTTPQTYAPPPTPHYLLPSLWPRP